MLAFSQSHKSVEPPRYRTGTLLVWWGDLGQPA